MAIDNSSLYKSLGLSLKSNSVPAASKNENMGKGELAIKDFLSLMTTQLKNQDPLKPMESGEFLGQIASFATVSGIEDLQKSFGSFATSMKSEQALKGSALVGHSVLVPSAAGNHTSSSPLSGVINVKPKVTDLSVQIYDSKGSLVDTQKIGPSSGNVKFTWDGKSSDGKTLAEGVYTLKATGTVDGKVTSFATATMGKVESVLVNNKNGLIVNLAGIGAVPFAKVQEIK
jgi:flagellar basal-body rod modification protein FlgD